MSDGNMQYVTSTAFLLVTYAKYLTLSGKVVDCGGTTVTPGHLRSIAKRQVDYILGDNPLKMSYMMGYDPRYPLRIHHWRSSLPAIAQHPAKIRLIRVLVHEFPVAELERACRGSGGPDQHDNFSNQRSDYQQSEPVTYINAPLIGVLTYLAHSYGQL